MMLAYAADRPLTGKRQSSPQAMLLIVSAHVALLAAVMSAKMERSPQIDRTPIKIELVKDPPPPPPPNQPPPRHIQPQPRQQWIDHPAIKVPIPPPEPVPVDTSGQSVDPVPVVGGGTSLVTELPKPPVLTPIRHDPRLLTSMEDLKPPYPASKLDSGEEASLRLRVSIDAQGRVTAVDPVGPADRAFLDAARRYMIAHWRYQPATEDGRAVAASTVITLRFQLDG